MTSPSPRSFPLRPATALLLLFSVATALTVQGCGRAEKRRAEERLKLRNAEAANARMARRPLEPGESVTFPFAADGLWHPSPYEAGIGQTLRVEGGGATPALAVGSMEFRIGGFKPMLITEQSEFRVEEPGAIQFRIIPRARRRFGDNAEAKITRLR